MTGHRPRRRPGVDGSAPESVRGSAPGAAARPAHHTTWRNPEHAHRPRRPRPARAGRLRRGDRNRPRQQPRHEPGDRRPDRGRRPGVRATAAANPAEPIAPSRVVDEGWHALILHTAVYAGLCERLGTFVHHYPERPDEGRQKADVLDRTTALMRSAGYSPDPELWTLPAEGRVPVAAKCGHAPRCGVTDPQAAKGDSHARADGGRE